MKIEYLPRTHVRELTKTHLNRASKFDFLKYKLEKYFLVKKKKKEVWRFKLSKKKILNSSSI